MSSLHLIGGGWDAAAAPPVYGPFLADATARAGGPPDVACLVLDEGDGSERFDRWVQVLTSLAPCTPRPLLIPDGQQFNPARLGNADALLVDGGLTPGYADALVPVADGIKAWLTDGDRPYCGFSAGAAIASAKAIIGGWRSAGVPVCPEDAGEDLDELTVVPGLGLTTWSVDVHCAQWGTLPRLVEGVRTGLAGGNGLGIDENTLVTIGPNGQLSVAGAGRAWLVHRTGGRPVQVNPVPAGCPIG